MAGNPTGNESPDFIEVTVNCKRCRGSGIDPVKAKIKAKGTWVEEDQACTGGCGGSGVTTEWHRKR